MPRRTSSAIRSVAPGAPNSRTARSQSASSRDTSAPAAATTPPSFDRNNSSRVESNTRLGIAERDLRDLLPRGRPALRDHAPTSPVQLLGEIGQESVRRDAILLQGVPVAHCDGRVLRGLAVDGDA